MQYGIERHEIMTKKMGAFAAAAASAALLFAPAASFADTASTHDYSTTLTQTQPLPSPGAYAGTLKLTLSSGGIVSGWYLPNDDARYVQVTGGEQGGKFWLTVGDRNGFTITGSVGSDGKLVGSATALDASAFGIYEFDNDGFPVSFDFVATPTSD
jgi:hypothetical protein